ncbi:MAG TPA: cupin domain-containing protein [Caulobacteraceae bacterium]
MSDILAPAPGPPVHIRGFVDVLTDRQDWPRVSEGETSGGTYMSERRRLPLPGGPITVDAVRLVAGDAGQTVLPGDEFVLVLSGDVRFEQSGGELHLGAGQAGVVPRGRSLAWRCDQDGELIVMRCLGGGGPTAQAPVRIELEAPLAPSNPPLAEFLVGPTPQCRNHTDYRSGSGEFVCGVWDSTPYHRRLLTFRHYELMSLLEGSVTFVDASGREGRFAAGDVVLLEQGGGCSWESQVHVKKIYSTFRPAE